MDRIICLVSESGGGKTTIAEILEKDGYNYVETYTTRKPRYRGERGHIFATEKDYIKDKKSIIAETYFDGNYYWTCKREYQGKGNSIYVVDTNGVRDIKKNIKDAEIIVIYLKTEEEVRKTRMIKRYRDTHINENTNFTERQYINGESYYIAKKRIEHDREAFKLIECNWVIDANRELTEVLNDVKTIIERS